MAMRSPIDEQLRPITFEEYRALPDDSPRFELIRGELIVAASPSSLHQRVAVRLGFALQEHVDARELGEVFMAPFDVRLAGDSAVQPDLFFVNKARKRIIGDDYCDGAPDLIAEILSPSNRRIDLIRKRVLYAEFSVSEYWIVDPYAQTISIDVIDGGNYAAHLVVGGVFGSKTFPELQLDVPSLFAVRSWMQDPAESNERA